MFVLYETSKVLEGQNSMGRTIVLGVVAVFLAGFLIYSLITANRD